MDDDAFRAAAGRESAHGAVAEHFGLAVEAVEIDWRGYPVCRYGGRIAEGVSARAANVVILLAGLVGERLCVDAPWRLSAGDAAAWLDTFEVDPGDRAETPLDPDLILALQAVDGDVTALQDLEGQAHALLTEDPGVAGRWAELRKALLDARGLRQP